MLAPDSGDTYCLLTVLPREKVNDFAASHRFGAARASRALEVRDEEELRLILAHPFAAWRAFLHPSQHEIAYRVSYSGSAQVTGGPGTGKTVTVLHRAAILAERAGQPRIPGPVLLTTFNGNLAESNMDRMDPKELVAAVTGNGPSGSTSGQDVLPDEAQELAQRVWWYLLFAGILLLIAETVLAHRYSRVRT